MIRCKKLRIAHPPAAGEWVELAVLRTSSNAKPENVISKVETTSTCIDIVSNFGGVEHKFDTQSGRCERQKQYKKREEGPTKVLVHIYQSTVYISSIIKRAKR